MNWRWASKDEKGPFDDLGEDSLVFFGSVEPLEEKADEPATDDEDAEEPFEYPVRNAMMQYNFWWAALATLPTSVQSRAYRRLKRVWFDQTGTRESFSIPAREVHRVVTLFENLALFPPSVWLPEMLAAAGLGDRFASIEDANWSYEWEDGETKAIADVVIHFRDRHGEAIIVIEAKSVRKNLDADDRDRDPSRYLDVAPLRRCVPDDDRRCLVYLLDECMIEEERPRIRDPKQRHGFLSWEDLGGIQVRRALALDLPDPYPTWIATALQHQFCSYGIRPTTLVHDYLADEPPFHEMPTSQKEGGQTTAERREELWRLEPET